MVMLGGSVQPAARYDPPQKSPLRPALREAEKSTKSPLMAQQERFCRRKETCPHPRQAINCPAEQKHARTECFCEKSSKNNLIFMIHPDRIYPKLGGFVSGEEDERLALRLHFLITSFC
jgi:hypothetical protein